MNLPIIPNIKQNVINKTKPIDIPAEYGNLVRLIVHKKWCYQLRQSLRQ